MSMSSVSPAASLTTPAVNDGNATESGVNASASGFDIILAAHADPSTDRAASDTGNDPSGSNDAGSSCATDASVEGNDHKPKTDQTVDAEALAAQLAAPAPLSTPIVADPAPP